MDGKFWRENGNENFFGVYSVRWEEREINGRVGYFLPEPIKKFSLQNEEKTKERKLGYLMDKNTLHLHMGH